MKPVALPPGRARLSTKPAATGSAAVGNTIGTVRVACSNGPKVGAPWARMTSGASATNSAAWSANFGGTGSGPAGVDPHVAADGPAQLLKPLQECPDASLKFRIVRGYGQKYADAPHPLGLLRARRERPRCRGAANERDERAAVHSMTSSARTSSDVGISRPSALAVVMLMTRSNLVGCSTGMSAGLAPRKILLTISAARRNRS